METTQAPLARTKALRVALTPTETEALARRAQRNDRFVWLEAGRIIRETLVRDGDLPMSDR